MKTNTNSHNTLSVSLFSWVKWTCVANICGLSIRISCRKQINPTMIPEEIVRFFRGCLQNRLHYTNFGLKSRSVWIMNPAIVWYDKNGIMLAWKKKQNGVNCFWKVWTYRRLGNSKRFGIVKDALRRRLLWIRISQYVCIDKAPTFSPRKHTRHRHNLLFTCFNYYGVM